MSEAFHFDYNTANKFSALAMQVVKHYRISTDLQHVLSYQAQLQDPCGDINSVARGLVIHMRSKNIT